MVLRYSQWPLKAHGLVERVGQSYRWRLSVKGQKVATLTVVLRKRVYGPLAPAVCARRPEAAQAPDCRLERAHHQVGATTDERIQCFAA